MFGMEADRLTGRKILIVGAMSALGPAIAHQLIRHGAEVLATDSRAASLTWFASWLDGAVQVRAAGPAAIAPWIQEAHPNLAGLILADPREQEANAALARALAPLLASNPDPFLAAVRFQDGRFSFEPTPYLPVTIGTLRTPQAALDTVRQASRLLGAISSRRPHIRLNGATVLSGRTPAPAAQRAVRADAY